MIGRRNFMTTAACGVLATLSSIDGKAAMTGSARQSGFYLPEETEPHERTFMQWPVSKRVYDDPIFLTMVQQTIADIANIISEFEPVVMLMLSDEEPAARRKLGRYVDIWPVPTDDLWCRDSGPLFVSDGKGRLAVSQMNFNGWGNKQYHANDGQVARRVAEKLGLDVFDNGIVGEPGGVETDGQGTLIAHESCWINKNRNSGSRKQVETLLLDALGAEKIVWAPGVAGADITDYHIDSLARFVRPGVILIQLPPVSDANDPWSIAAFETYEILRQASDKNGRPFEIVVVQEPFDPRISSPDFVASYVNYYVCNGGVIAAGFGDRDTDNEAESTLKRLYPDREIVTLNVDPVGEVGGGIHCATQQQPAI
jgi:agmatine deiminase